MKKFLYLFVATAFIFSCSTNDAVPESSDAITGNWNLESQIVDNNETITDCTKQTTFSFESDRILRRQFYTMPNTTCVAGNQIISSWLHLGNTKYQINTNGSFNEITVTFLENNTKFSISETNSNNNVTISVFKKI
ncbi:hypothetical protein IU405_02350 [Polaribacter sp. BAL334]|uniref:hypothetical protein n=1 Tax=Polaribacter sp. BAL334 TaxID=1708178 RepID=UPI0018D232E3|nr:hypothetical protein [Polaribacter sp. BAL334]MBG7611079.1 hypothetical protein [Polaribacter sp. BAL334]